MAKWYSVSVCPFLLVGSDRKGGDLLPFKPSHSSFFPKPFIYFSGFIYISNYSNSPNWKRAKRLQIYIFSLSLWQQKALLFPRSILFSATLFTPVWFPTNSILFSVVLKTLVLVVWSQIHWLVRHTYRLWLFRLDLDSKKKKHFSAKHFVPPFLL